MVCLFQLEKHVLEINPCGKNTVLSEQKKNKKN